MTHLSELIKEVRASKGYSLSEVALHLGVTRQCVHQMERGLMKCPLNLLPKLSECLSIKRSVLLKAIVYDFENDCVKVMEGNKNARESA